MLHCTEITYFFPRRHEKMFFPKTLRWNMIFLVLSEKMKIKDDLSQKKIQGNMIFSSNFLKRVSFQKGPRWDMIFLVLSWIMVFFSRKNDIFSLGTKWEMTFLKKYIETWYFLCIPTGVTNVASRPSVKKNQKWSYSAKIHLKVIDVLDWHPRKSSSNSLYFHGDLYRRFHVLLSSEKNQET